MADFPEKGTENARHVEDIEKRPDSEISSDIKQEQLQTLDEQNIGEEDVITDLSAAETKRIIRKVDYRIVPLLTFLYLVAFIDRSNIGNAKIAGMQTDLNLQGLKYNAAVTLFYVPYTLLEVPSNIVLKLMRPSRWISILLFSWGLVMTLMGLVESYAGLLVARWFLGVAEAGFFPAATFLLTICMWSILRVYPGQTIVKQPDDIVNKATGYKRYEYQQRFAVFYSMASMAGAFSGLLAFAIENMDGVGGRSGWQWIFILEGLVPVAFSFILWKILPDSPETATFLEKHEKEFIINRVAAETGSGSGRVTNTDKIRWHHIRAGLSEWKVWAMIVVYWGNSVGVYGFSATVPTVINELGYTEAQAQLLTIPLYVFAVILVLIFAFLSDRFKVRWIFIVIAYAIAACSFIAQLAIPHPKYPGVTYGFLFGVAGGMYAAFPPLMAWAANNIAPSSKRAVAMALLISVGNMGAIAGSNIYLAREAPKYQTGFGSCLGFCGVGALMACFLRFAYARENKRRDKLVEQIGEQGIKAQYSEQELLDLGDNSPFFRYAL